MAVQLHGGQAGSGADAWFRPLFEGNGLAMLACDAQSLRVLDLNQAMVEQFGHGRAALLGMHLPELLAAQDGAAGPFGRVHRFLHADGSARQVLPQPWPVGAAGRAADTDADGAHGGLVLVALQDVTFLVDEQARLMDDQDELRRAQALGLIGNWRWDGGRGAVLAASPEGYRILGFPPGDLPVGPRDVLARIHIEDRAAVLAARRRALAEPERHVDLQFRMVQPDGELRWVHVVAEVRRDGAGPPALSGLVQDITARRGVEEDVMRLAYYDTLTGLPNRNLFERHCRARLAQLGRDRLACLIVDLVHFRDVNYALTHLYGDLLLALVADRLGALIDGAGLLARVDARFTILLEDADEARARHWAARIHEVLEAPFSVVGIWCALGARIGVALAPSQGRDYHTLLRKADIALYQAAQAGRNTAVYDAGIDPHTPGRLSLVGDFRAAIEDGQLRLFCQPKVDIRSRQIVGAEALVRWWHPEKGCIAPESFVPLLESTELIHLLTGHMLEGAVAQCEAWRSEGVLLPIAVNLSARDVGVLALSEQLRALLERHGSRAGMIGLEVTESSLMSNPTAGIAELQRLSAMGFRLYVDDFGTGYSSLSYLSRLPVDVIKIDHAFTMKMIDDPRAAAIVKSTIHLAHDLGMEVVAEGVSERRIWDALQALGCDEAQGYYIAPPLPAEDLLAWARSSPYSLRGERATA
ncbi:EAL domain-containing protein [Massilia forsythiae]|uniref:EAL domain-containing protein n=1 Tax=Massilia forsythiae TaxID=2728020 RepID=A0A7Z2VZA1_9BURK|nr:EAL domain-containing protein [Massilia forsythiae]QJE02168.1 EAL domain-containing protein [Massilia forsythiae]